MSRRQQLVLIEVARPHQPAERETLVRRATTQVVGGLSKAVRVVVFQRLEPHQRLADARDRVFNARVGEARSDAVKRAGKGALRSPALRLHVGEFYQAARYHTTASRCPSAPYLMPCGVGWTVE